MKPINSLLAIFALSIGQAPAIVLHVNWNSPNGPILNVPFGSWVEFGVFQQPDSSFGPVFQGDFVVLGAAAADGAKVVFSEPAGGAPFGSVTLQGTQAFDLQSLWMVQPAFRFYNTPDPNDATAFNTYSSPDWRLFPPPTTDGEHEMTFSLTPNGNLIWEDGASSAFQATIPVPEPSSLLFAIAGAFTVLSSRRR